MAWWRRRKRTDRPRPAGLISIGDPALAELFRLGPGNYAGVNVGEGSALGLSAFYRAVSLVSGTIAMLPMHTIRDVDGVITRVRSIFDDPGAVIGMTRFEWVQTVIAHQMIHGDAFLAHIYNVGGGLAGLAPIHPQNVQVDPPPRNPTSELQSPFRKTYTATLQDGSRQTFTQANMTHCPGLSIDSRRGISLLAAARNSLGIAIAGDRAAAKMFSDGALMGGLATPKEGEEVSPDDVKTIQASLNENMGGWENAGAVALVNRRLDFAPWTMSNKDAQFLDSRQFQVEEQARWTGVPPHLLMQTEKQTSWGTGVAEQNRGLSRYTLSHWTVRLEQRLSRLLAAPRFVVFDFTEWERPTPETEIPLLIQEVQAGLITPNEYRKRRHLPPLPGGDELRDGPTPAEEMEPTPAEEMEPA